ncbi:hypothetical protein ACEN9F_13310 [Duganella sp. CT11-25]|uniref:hypothetical protein n=1 Tax=unclassified Duganella TaxID=2636909 RepID=UPI0039B0FBAA
MYSKIIQKRYRGVERPDRDLSNDPGTFGMIEMHRVGGFVRMQVRMYGNQLPEAVLLPALWDATCEEWSGTMMSWNGYQQAQLPEKKGQSAYFQQWIIEIIGERPPPDKIKGHFDTYNVGRGDPPADAAGRTPAAP